MFKLMVNKKGEIILRVFFGYCFSELSSEDLIKELKSKDGEITINSFCGADIKTIKKELTKSDSNCVNLIAIKKNENVNNSDDSVIVKLTLDELNDMDNINVIADSMVLEMCSDKTISDIENVFIQDVNRFKSIKI